MMRMTLSPCNNPRVNAVDTADRGFKPQCHVMACEKKGVRYMTFSPINIGVLIGCRCGPHGVAPLTLCGSGDLQSLFGCHGGLSSSERVAALRYITN